MRNPRMTALITSPVRPVSAAMSSNIGAEPTPANSALVVRARERRASTDLTPVELGATNGAPSTPHPLVLEPSGVRSAVAHEVCQHSTQRSQQTTRFSIVERSCGATGVDLGPPHRLVSDEVADPGDTALVEQASLQGNLADEHPITQLLRLDLEGIDAERRLVGIQRHAAETTRVSQPEVATVGESTSDWRPPMKLGG